MLVQGYDYDKDAENNGNSTGAYKKELVQKSKCEQMSASVPIHKTWATNIVREHEMLILATLLMSFEHSDLVINLEAKLHRALSHSQVGVMSKRTNFNGVV